MSWHQHNWGHEPVIASLSIGATRTFQFRNYEDKEVVRSFELTRGSLLIMKGANSKMLGTTDRKNQ